MFGLTGLNKKKQVVKELVCQLMKDLPPELVSERRSKLSVNRVTHQIDAIYSRAEELRDQHRFGFISKAAMINDFQWELKQHNYPLDFIEMVVEGLVLRLQSRKSRKP